MKRKTRRRLWGFSPRIPTGAWIFIFFMLEACGSPVPVEPSPLPATNTPGSTPTSTALPTPEFDLEFLDVHWVKSATPPQWILIGKVVNHEDYPIEKVEVLVQLPGQDTTRDGPFRSLTVPPVIPPSGEAIFQIALPDVPHQADYSISAIGDPSEARTETSFVVRVTDWRDLPDGRVQAIGEVENRGDHLLNVRAVDLLVYDEDGQPLGVAGSDHIISTLPPQASTPFSALIDGQVPIGSWEAFVDARPELLPPDPPLVLSDVLRTEEIRQDRSYLLGEVENGGVTPWWVVLDVAYTYEDEIIGLDTISLPFPLLPDERIAFVVDPARSLPSGLLAGLDLASIEIEVSIDPWRSLPTLNAWQSVAVQITQFERIGDRLYVRGSINNTHTVPISSPAVVLQILDVHGKIRAIGWMILPNHPGPGEQLGFTMDLLIPEGLDLNLVEFDLRALAAFDEEA